MSTPPRRRAFNAGSDSGSNVAAHSWGTGLTAVFVGRGTWKGRRYVCASYAIVSQTLNPSRTCYQDLLYLAYVSTYHGTWLYETDSRMHGMISYGECTHHTFLRTLNNCVVVYSVRRARVVTLNIGSLKHPQESIRKARGSRYKIHTLLLWCLLVVFTLLSRTWYYACVPKYTCSLSVVRILVFRLARCDYWHSKYRQLPYVLLFCIVSSGFNSGKSRKSRATNPPQRPPARAYGLRIATRRTYNNSVHIVSTRGNDQTVVLRILLTASSVPWYLLYCLLCTSIYYTKYVPPVYQVRIILLFDILLYTGTRSAHGLLLCCCCCGAAAARCCNSLLILWWTIWNRDNKLYPRTYRVRMYEYHGDSCEVLISYCFRHVVNKKRVKQWI